MFLWIKALHIISVISWMVGMLYLPRLFVYHSSSTIHSEMSETFKVMERRLLYYIMTPAMIVSWFFGLWLFLGSGNISYYMMSGWFHIKLLMVILLTGMHLMFYVFYKNFENDERQYQAKTYKIINEIPTILMIIIVIMVVVKPL